MRREGRHHAAPTLRARAAGRREAEGAHAGGLRSEEHTSELQSQSNLVCRLLLEKKKTHPDTMRLRSEVLDSSLPVQHAPSDVRAPRSLLPSPRSQSCPTPSASCSYACTGFIRP